MDFYESARFQYSASRLLVKLDNFRRTGSFPKKITYNNTPDILILPTRRGSFGIDVIIPVLQAAAPVIYEAPLGAMLSYVIDRVFSPADDDVIKSALANNDHLLDVFERTIEGRDEALARTLEMLQRRMDNDDDIDQKIWSLYERLLADQERKALLSDERAVLQRIPADDEAELITMAAPLLKEMNVPLRRSARKVNISATANDNETRILYANKSMADAVDTQKVDRRLTTIDINIVQFNKESGWGKFENDEWDGRPSFSIPGEMLDDLKQFAVNAMHKDMVEVDCYFVRSAAGVPQRILVTDIREIEE
ncbi:hypothetical protein [Sphingomonas sp. VDB2]|uniref:hypothetical protein n=1 Tax=Sphingomonas sp. VDB2 TaxID=3228751 RepID=UPI003A801F20